MPNIMICVTGQLECERLIDYALELSEKKTGEIFLVHVSSDQRKFTDSIDALQYLYTQAVENGASLNVLKSKNVLDTLEQFISENKIDIVIMGESREQKKENSMVDRLQARIFKRYLNAKIHIVAKDARR